MTSSDAQSRKFTITLLGDIMLGRLIDQCLPEHVDEPREQEIASYYCTRHNLQDYTHTSPWGNTLSLFAKSDLVLGNLETSATTHDVKWPNKVFNYRMHPINIKCLTVAEIDYVSLANNHTLDFSTEGLLETVKTLKQSGIAYAGAAETAMEADKPAELMLQPDVQAEDNHPEDYTVHVYSFSDHPSDWGSIEQFNLLDYSAVYKQKLYGLLTSHPHPALKIVSIHWGPNYRWHPSQEIKDMAHFLIDDCAADVVWGHSSHHIQGVEIYKGKLIIYGCGDFVDDYAINREYRNDLSAAWNLQISATGDKTLKLTRLEVWPNRIRHFQAGFLEREDADHEWIVAKFTALCTDLGTTVNEGLGSDGQIIVDMTKHEGVTS